MAFDWKKYCTDKYPDFMTLEQLKVYVAKGKITPADFKDISGEDYVV